MKKSSLIILCFVVVFIVIIGSIIPGWTIDFRKVALMGAAYGTHIFFHEVGHQVVAEDAGADSPEMHFFVIEGGGFYPGLSTYKSIPSESKLPYAAGGERMTSYTFEFALQSYHRQPTTYNEALMFFGCADFFAYTLLANYVHPENDMYDPNLIREETGLSKEAMLSLITAKTLLNAYRVFNPKAKLIPWIRLDKEKAVFMIGTNF